MGMFNEVFCTCPECDGVGYLQIPQLVLGFGEFHIDNPETLLELSYDDLNVLKNLLDKEEFSCQKCGNYFLYSQAEEDKLEYIKKLFG